jgi:atypical dual specificity phosphatase
MAWLNFSWLIDDEVAGHAEPTSEEDLASLFTKGIRALVRMSEHPKVSPGQVTRQGMDDLHEPVPDFASPSQEQLGRIIGFITKSIWDGKPVGVSCGAGIGRTGTVLACYLAERALTAKGFIIEVRRTRPGAVETSGQFKTVEEYVRRLLSGTGSASNITSTPLEFLMHIAAERHYGRGFEHADAVTKLSRDLYQHMVHLRLFPETDADLLLIEASGYLHDVGYPPDKDHNIKGFKWLRERFTHADARNILSPLERQVVLHCVLWHRGSDFGPFPGEVKPEPQESSRARRLASVLRIADGLCYPADKPTKEVRVTQERDTVVIEACPSRRGDSLSLQISKATEKKDLLEEVLNDSPRTGIVKVRVTRCSHVDC